MTNFGKLLFLFALTACGSEGLVDDSADPCAAADLPVCPEECPEDAFSECGESCETEGEVCGNNIGDGRECVDGIWQCTVHAPLGGPGECNLVCG
jgi:hypothetical protein